MYVELPEWRNKKCAPQPRVDVVIIIFGDFAHFLRKKFAFFSKTNVMIFFFKN
jgi:hypothetical protein